MGRTDCVASWDRSITLIYSSKLGLRHMWTAPWLQEFVRVNPIACDHMSGLLSRSHMTAAKMGSATRGPNNQTASFANGSHGLSRVLGSIDHTHLLEQARPPACWVSPL